MAQTPATIIYIPHGGGPMPLLGDPAHHGLIEFLQTLHRRFPRPDAILIISAHWEERVPTITGGERPSLFYDYYGFPEEAYRIHYPAPGAPQLAAEIQKLLHDSGVQAALDTGRGYDHGMFVPLKLMYPEADIACVQLSLLASLDAAAHIALGEALSALRHRNLLIMGSGMSFHNLRSFFLPGRDDNENFHRWLIDTCADPRLTREARRERLINWQAAPSALACHPRPEHLLPLHVCFGMAGKDAATAEVVFNQAVMDRAVAGFLWR